MDVHVPEPIVSREDELDPEQEALLADSVGLALLVVLETLAPRSGSRSCCTTCSPCPSTRSPPSWGAPRAARQLASRARRQVQGAPVPDADLSRQREIVDAFFAAGRDGDFDALVAVLDPDVVLRSDGGALRPGASVVVRGARAVAAQAVTSRSFARSYDRRS